MYSGARKFELVFTIYTAIMQYLQRSKLKYYFQKLESRAMIFYVLLFYSTEIIKEFMRLSNFFLLYLILKTKVIYKKMLDLISVIYSVILK